MLPQAWAWTSTMTKRSPRSRQSAVRSPNGLTSIYADLRDGRRSEVDTISGSVVRAGKKSGVATPSHEFLVELIHAMEGRPKA